MASKTFALAALLILGQSSANAQTKNGPATKSSEPDVLVLPWLLPGLSSHLRPSKQALAASYDALAKTVINDPESVAKWAERSKVVLTLNAARKGAKIMVGKAHNGPQGIERLGVQPVLCYFYDKMLLYTELFDLGDQVRGYGSISISRREWVDALAKEAGVETLLSQQLLAAWEKAAAGPPAPKGADNAVKVGLTVAKENRRQSTVSPQCLTAMTGHSLLGKYRVVRTLGYADSDFVWWALGLPHRSQRATRRLTVVWDVKATGESAPSTFTGRFRPSEAVFGKLALPYLTGELLVTADKGPELMGEVVTWLGAEANLLKRDDQPTVIRVYKAWAYLDRGRAWGLKMDDRLYTQGPDGPLKGHVIGYFGPGHNLKNAAGQRVNEGAILFIRTGQKQLKKGMQFGFDPTNFPTVWPPVKTPVNP